MNQPNNIKVAIITMSFPYNREAFAVNEFLHLQKHCDVTIHSLRPKHKMADELVEKHQMAHLTLSHHTFRTLLFFVLNVLKYPIAFWELLRCIFQIKFKKTSYRIKAFLLVPRVMELLNVLKKNPPDVVHAYWSHYPGLVGFVAKKYLKDTGFTMSHVAYDVYRGYNMAARTKDAFDIHFSICEENLKHIQSLDIERDKIKIVYRGIPELYANQALANKQKFSILSVGTLLPVKSFDLVLEVFAKLKLQYPEARLTIVGDGPQREFLLEKKEKMSLLDVEFTGYLLRDEVMELMNEAEVFLLMSKNERLANVVKEAMLMQCYCVVTQTPGVEELIQHESNGLIIENGNVDEAVTSIKNIWNDEKHRQHIPGKAREMVCDKFILEKNIQRYINTWEKLVNRQN